MSATRLAQLVQSGNVRYAYPMAQAVLDECIISHSSGWQCRDCKSIGASKEDMPHTKECVTHACRAIVNGKVWKTMARGIQ